MIGRKLCTQERLGPKGGSANKSLMWKVKLIH